MLRNEGAQGPRNGPRKGAGRRGFGRVRRERSGRYSAAYVGPDGRLHRAPSTFDAKVDAEGWLGAERRLIDLDTWEPPADRDLARRQRYASTPLLGDYAKDWIDRRMVRGRELKPRTRALYRNLLAKQIEPGLGSLELKKLTPGLVARWYVDLGSRTPTQRAHAYALLKSICATAVKDKVITANPCEIEGAGQGSAKRTFEPLTPQEIVALAEAMPEKYQLMVLLAGWAGLRFGELAELRRQDVDVATMTLKIRRGVVRAEGSVIIGDTKSTAGVRDVHVPPHLRDPLEDHLRRYAQPGRDGLLFPARNGGNLAPSTLYGEAPTKRVTPEGAVWEGGTNFYRARAAIGRPDLRFHDLRHSAAVLAALSGATLAELMARLGHSTHKAALRYQQVASGRDAEIARKLSEMAAPVRPQQDLTA